MVMQSGGIDANGVTICFHISPQVGQQLLDAFNISQVGHIMVGTPSPG